MHPITMNTKSQSFIIPFLFQPFKNHQASSDIELQIFQFVGTSEVNFISFFNNPKPRYTLNLAILGS